MPAMSHRSAAKTARGPSLKVLIADDHAFSREVVARIASALGHQVTSVDGGHAALEAVAAASFDVAVIDRRMPDMDGAAVAIAMKAHPGHPRLVALSGDDPADMLPGLFDVVLQKPVDAAVLARALAG
ncbi:MAG: two-component hybrid sensor and regulator [Xanthobacteraceae bacterium]|nr:MAG: two-component hybrid sensor and regulator [Xanthobacteraceae bacterium]